MDAGPVMATGRPMDIAMADAAVLTVQGPDGGLAFTRRGDLKVNIQGQLENGSGHLVLGETVPSRSHRV
jgi:flagellar basal-body rod protein FlgF